MKLHLTKPADGAEVSLLTEEHRRFLQTGGSGKKSESQPLDWLHLKRQGQDHSGPAPVVFAWETEEEEGEKCQFKITFSKDSSFQNCREFFCRDNTFQTSLCLLGETGYWFVCAYRDGHALCRSEIRQFTVAMLPPRLIFAEGLSNIRDLGGWQGRNGKRIRQGLIYRGCEMEFHHTVTEQGKRTLRDALQIKTDLDLREEAMGKVFSSALGAQVNHVLLPVKAYGDFLKEEEKEVCRQLFHLFTEKGRYPFYIHCWGGADRTGTVLFLLGGILGMSEQDLFLDYEFTSFSVWGDRSVHSELFCSLLKGLQPYGKEGDSINQKCEAYLLSAGVTETELNRIREMMLQP